MSKQQSGLTMCTVAADLTATDGAATTYTTSNTVLYSIAGKAYTTAGDSTTAFVSALGAQSGAAIGLTVDTARIVVFCMIADGTVRLVEGPKVDTDPDTDTYYDGRWPEFPTVNLETYCPFAYQVMIAIGTLSGSSSGAGIWTLGTDNWNSTGMTNTAVDVMQLPLRPKVT